MDKHLIQHLSCKTGTPLLQLTEWVEDWEEKKDKGYEILSFSGVINKQFILKVSDIPKCYDVEDYTKPNSSFNIHSVKRLRDMEVLAIRDTIEISNGNKYEITSFEVNRLSQSISVHAGGKIWHFDYVRKAKQLQALFTTEDNVAIYEGDKYWFVDKKWEVLYNDFAHKIALSGYFPETYKYFSTEEKANEYVLLKKPILSVEEISEYLDTIYNLDPAFTKMKLIDLAKKKLNG